MKYVIVALFFLLLAGLVVIRKADNKVLITPTPSVVQTPQVEKNITVASPTQNAAIANPVMITGTARVFENVINYRIKDSKGGTLATGHMMAASPDVGQFGPYEVQAPYKKPTTQYGVIEVYWYSPKDGAELDKQVIYVKFP